MATEDKEVKVTEEYAPDGSLTKKTKEYPPKKTFSDWVVWVAQVLAAGAVVVSIVALVFGAYQFKAQQSASAVQTLEQQRQTTFDTYLDRMSELLLIDHLQTAKSDSPVLAIAEARTVTALRDLDGSHRAELVRFLWKAGLVKGKQPVISLSAAPLSSTMFQHALLKSINLSGALLISSTFDDCDLRGANFSMTVLPGAILNNVNLAGANMIHANLYGATLEDVTLTNVNLTDASLQRANLSGDDLTKVNLTNANLDGANLKGAQITPSQLKSIASLHGAILPDGLTHS